MIWPQITLIVWSSISMTYQIMEANKKGFNWVDVPMLIITTGCFHGLLYIGGWYDVFFNI